MTTETIIALTGGLFVFVFTLGGIWGVLRIINFRANYTPPPKQVPPASAGLGWFMWAMIIVGLPS